jgi:hypothetical protein
MNPSSLDAPALTTLLRAQDGLISLDQARECGLTPSALSRRIKGPTSGWSRVLPRVYLHGEHELTERQRTRAAVLFAGPGGILTGNAALRWHRIKHLPAELPVDRVDVVSPPGRQLRSKDWALLHRSERPAVPYSVDGVQTMPVTRAIIDAAREFSDETLLAVMCAAVNCGRTSPDQLRDELVLAPAIGSGGLRRALSELDAGSRSFPEDEARRLFARYGLPEPLVNEPLLVDGRLFVPDFDWGPRHSRDRVQAAPPVGAGLVGPHAGTARVSVGASLPGAAVLTTPAPGDAKRRHREPAQRARDDGCLGEVNPLPEAANRFTSLPWPKGRR